MLKSFWMDFKVGVIICTEWFKEKYLGLLEVASILIMVGHYLGGSYTDARIFLALAVVLGALSYVKNEILKEIEYSREYVLDYTKLTTQYVG